MNDRRRKLIGLLALGCYAAHGAVLIRRGEPEDLLWVCHLGAVFIGVGLLTRSAALNGVGTLFGCFGTPWWLLDLAAGGEFIPTSCLTHLFALSFGLWGVRRLGMPSGTWWKATLGLVALIALARVATPARANVNLAFRIHPGWEGHFRSHEVYLAVIVSESALYFALLELAMRRWLAPAVTRRKDR